MNFSPESSPETVNEVVEIAEMYCVTVVPSTVTTQNGVFVKVGVAKVTPGRYLARVEVDGAQSPLDQGPDGTFTGPVVTL